MPFIPVEQHGDKLDDHDSKEEEHEHDTNRLKVEVLLGDKDLGKEKLVKEIPSMLQLLIDVSNYTV